MAPATPSPPAPRPVVAADRTSNPLATAALIIVVMAGLYIGQDILIPLALAALLSFVLAPVAIRLDRLGLRRVPSVLLVVALACAVTGGVSLIVGSQIVSLADNISQYRLNIIEKVHSLQLSFPGQGIIGKTSTVLKEIGSELSAGSEQPKDQLAAPGQERRQEPVPVRIDTSQTNPLDIIRNVIGPLLGPIATAGLVVVFVSFMLIEREDMRNRFIRLIGGRDLNATTEALDEAARRVSRYLLSQLVVNVTYGLPIGIGLYVIGIPNALLWGVLATVLRFVPYLGPFIAASFPLALAVAVDPGWTMVAWTVALFLVIELISNNVVEPVLYGSSTGLSSVAVILAAIFWTLLWGPVGLFLSTPLTVCLVVIGRYVPQLQFLDVLLGSEPVLTPAERFYQRMLASDWEEGADIAEEYLKEGKSLAAFHDEVVLPALRLAEWDRQRQALPPDRVEAVAAAIDRVIDELEPDDGESDLEQPADASVLCGGGRTLLDRTAGRLLAQLLRHQGVAAQVLPLASPRAEDIMRIAPPPTRIIVLAYLGASGLAHARHACRRLRRRLPEAVLVIALWNGQRAPEKSADPAAEIGADLTATTLQETLAQVLDRLAEASLSLAARVD